MIILNNAKEQINFSGGILNMYILAYNCYVFNAAACLLKDGDLIAYAQEERFTRKKHTGDFPIHSINYCLKEAGITINDVDYIGFHWQPFHKFHLRIAQVIKNFPKSLKMYNTYSGEWIHMVYAKKLFQKHFAAELQNRTKPFKFFRVKHPICHAASAFLVSPFKEAAILTMDGSGEIASTTISVGEGNTIKTIKEINFPHSLGYIFVAITHYLGFTPNSDEYKLMSLKSYGQQDHFYDEVKQIIQLTSPGEYSVDLSYFNYDKGIRDPWVSEKFIKIFGPIREQDEPITSRHENIAWAFQKRLEDVAMHIAKYIYDETKKDYLCIAGGTALNSVMNGKLLKDGPFKDIFVQPAANDAGTCIGSAYYIYNTILNNPRNFVFNTAYLGPKFNNEEIKVLLDSKGVKYKYFEKEDELLNNTAKLIADGNVIGWFQGRMELGPRALGARSILADPRRQDMQDILNLKVKHREGFRPFAPSVLEEYAQEYFDCDRPSPYMLFVVDVKKDMHDKVPAITHVDGTARFQTVNKLQSPRYWKLIKEFQELTSVPVVVNTSFNVMGEPIVCSPEEALRCFQSTGIDHLVVENFIIEKEKAG